MLTYEEFKQTIRQEVKSYLPPEYADYELQEHKVYRINRCTEVITLMPPQSGKALVAAPTLNYPDLYESLLQGSTLEEVLRTVAHALQIRPPQCVENMMTAEPEVRKEDLIVGLINRKRNEELLKDVPHQPFLDLAAIALLQHGEDSGYTCTVTRAMMEQDLCMTKEELLERACENTFTLYPAQFMGPENLLYADCDGSYFGAACLLDRNMLDAAAKILGDDMIVLPDSTRGIFLMSTARMTPAEAKKMYRDAQAYATAGKDYLSDNIYLYHRKTRQLELYKGVS